jgi:mono/diheme cytochrome c family protein
MHSFARLSLAALLLYAASPTHSATAQQPKKAADGSVGGGDVARGKYIVENVAMCWRCHTPGGEGGTPDMAHWLQGAPIRCPESAWAVFAPRLAGRPPGTDEQFVTLLTTGITRTGAPPRPPMPRFHMTKADAESVLAYLKSL